MSFTRYEQRDSVVSAETVVKGAWANNQTTIAEFEGVTFDYYTDVYNNDEIQFSIQYGHISGSGSININPDVPNYSVSKVIYGQYRNLIYGTENTAILDSGLTGNPIRSFFAINVSRACYRESIKPGSLTLILSSSVGTPISLTDDSQTTVATSFIDSNIYHTLRSGSQGVLNPDATTWGYLFPNLGIILLDSWGKLEDNGVLTGVNNNTSSNSDPQNVSKLFNTLNSDAGSFTLQSQETISSRYMFTRMYNGDYNYTTNPSIIDDAGNLLYATLIDNPQTYVTTVGLYNDNTDLLAVAKLSKPLVKDFTKESLIRIKLEF